MSRCKSCKIEILDHSDKCPLCHRVLETGDKERRNSYPDARVLNKQIHLAANIVLFASLVVGWLAVYIEWQIAEEHFWSFLVVLGLIYANVVLRMAMIGKSSYQFKGFFWAFTAILLMYGVDVLTGNYGWSLTFGFPGVIVVLDIGIFVLMFVNHRNWQSYMMAEIVVTLISIIPPVLYACDVIDFYYPAVGANVFSFFLFLGTLIIGDRRAREELRRRFHW